MHLFTDDDDDDDEQGEENMEEILSLLKYHTIDEIDLHN
jgi:hypothetical protein